jgi:flagellar biogenesis protein FliO
MRVPPLAPRAGMAPRAGIAWRSRLQRAAGLALLPVAWPAAAHAQAGSGVTSFGAGDWLNLGLRLALVVAIIWGAVAGLRWYTRRLNGGSLPGRQLQIVETRALGPNRSLHLVRLGSHAVLVGVTAERISPLLQIDDADEVERLTTTAADGPPPRSLRSLVGGLTGVLQVGFLHAETLRARVAARRRDMVMSQAPVAPGFAVSEYEQVEALGGGRGVRLSDLEEALDAPRTSFGERPTW